MRGVVVLGLVLVLDACSDPVGVCDAARACEVSGVDLAVTRVEVANPRTVLPGGRLVADRDIELRYVVLNRGSVGSNAAQVTGWLENWWADGATADTADIPALAPGDSATGILHIRLDMPFVYDSVHTAAASVIRQSGSADADVANDRLSTSAFELSLPNLEFTFDPIGVPRVRANEPFPLDYTIRNRSRYESLSGVSAYVCLYDGGDMPCYPDWAKTMAARFELPALAPGESRQEQRMVSIAPTGAWQDEAWDFGFVVCVIESSWPDAYGMRPNLSCKGGRAVRVRPDYENVCHPPVLQLDVPLAVTEFNCGFSPPTLQDTQGHITQELRTTTRMLSYRFHIVAFDLVAGRHYSLLQLNGNPAFTRITDAEGERQVATPQAADFTVPRTGRYYAVNYSITALQLVLRQR